jgi:hypothetical protein
LLQRAVRADGQPFQLAKDFVALLTRRSIAQSAQRYRRMSKTHFREYRWLDEILRQENHRLQGRSLEFSCVEQCQVCRDVEYRLGIQIDRSRRATAETVQVNLVRGA